jgi:hypothetical protein
MAGLANLSEFFENPLFTETIREVPVETGYIGSRFLPSENTYDMEWNETVIERQADMADLVDAGAELPLTDRDPVRRVSGSIADMGQSYILTKKELAAMSDKGNEGRRKMAVQQVLKKTAQLKSNIDARVEWLRWQALGNGAMIYDKSGIKLGVDFGVPEANKVTAATAWGADGATILANYERWVQDYIDGNDNGYAPDVFVTGIENIRIVLNDVAIRKAITGYSDKLLTLDELTSFVVVNFHLWKRSTQRLLTVTLQTVVRELPPVFWTARRACSLWKVTRSVTYRWVRLMRITWNLVFLPVPSLWSVRFVRS